jgi:geranylgeranyl pyrophosphate synthase
VARACVPRLCIAVAAACGEPESTLADAAGASIELLHCASLVHDDLPCFDDAPCVAAGPRCIAPSTSAWRCSRAMR